MHRIYIRTSQWFWEKFTLYHFKIRDIILTNHSAKLSVRRILISELYSLTMGQSEANCSLKITVQSTGPDHMFEKFWSADKFWVTTVKHFFLENDSDEFDYILYFIVFELQKIIRKFTYSGKFYYYFYLISMNLNLANFA